MVGTIPVLLLSLFSALAMPSPDWGFFGHKLANKHAVFTLPSDLIGFYKNHINYLEDHAVDPDKRRYASPYEAVRHYIDLDRADGVGPESLARSWTGALAQHLELHCVNGDTLNLDLSGVADPQVHRFVRNVILPIYYEEEWITDHDSVFAILGLACDTCQTITASEDLTEHGVLPWNLIAMQRRLTRAFEDGDTEVVLRLSADIGHYIGDAHVPLHTSENYNGQLTGQDGIHAFWESRVPELLADRYDFFVGRAEYIADPVDFFWDIVLSSHKLVDSVLTTERELTNELGEEGKYCFDQRGSTIVKTYCADFAAEFDAALSSMAERRLRATIHAIGSAWYTAWVDGGKPDLPRGGYIATEKELQRLDDLESAFTGGKLKGRLHID